VGQSVSWFSSGAALFCSSGFQPLFLSGPATEKQNALCIPKCHQQLPCPFTIQHRPCPKQLPLLWITEKENTSDIKRRAVHAGANTDHLFLLCANVLCGVFLGQMSQISGVYRSVLILSESYVEAVDTSATHPQILLIEQPMYIDTGNYGYVGREN
jgi:hypothetical protein